MVSIEVHNIGAMHHVAHNGCEKMKIYGLDHSPLVMKEPFLLRAESLLEVESQRSSGSDSSGKKPLVRSTGDCSAPTTLALPTQLPPLLLLPLPVLPGDSSGLWIGLRLWLTFTEVISLLMSNWRF